jgi:hypothetical protein
MREQAVIAHADAERPGDPPQHHRGEDGAPVDVEERGDRADVKRAHGNGRDPVDLAIGGLSAINLGDWNHLVNDSSRTRQPLL